MDRPLPEDLRRLSPAGGTLPVELPAGRLVLSDEGDGMPAFWLSDEPVGLELWSQLRAGHSRSGFWPLLLVSDDDEGRPWATGEVWLDGSSPADHDPEALLRAWWQRNVHPEQIASPMFGPSQPAIPDDLITPFGESWPGGPAAVLPNQADPGDRADALTQWVLDKFPTARLGMVAAGSGADALTAAGWHGPVNHTNDTGQISAVVRGWEKRYGARVVALHSYATLFVSVSAPPAEREQALRVAAEHFAFCPDNIWQGARGATLSSYADQLVDSDSWAFWWD